MSLIIDESIIVQDSRTVGAKENKDMTVYIDSCKWYYEKRKWMNRATNDFIVTRNVHFGKHT